MFEDPDQPEQADEQQDEIVDAGIFQGTGEVIVITPPGSTDVDGSVVPITTGTAGSSAGSVYDRFGEAAISAGPTIYWTEKDRREAAIEKRFIELGGVATWGAPLRQEVGSYRFYRDIGLVYHRGKKKVICVRDRIYRRWRDLGGLDWGVPDANDGQAEDGVVRVCHFNDGDVSIYESSAGAYVIYGDIRQCWLDRGGVYSDLGYPTSDEMDFADGGRTNSFVNGDIYWWGDTGAIPIRSVVVRYTGFHCFGETDWDQGSNSDEPYFIMTLASPFGTAVHSTQVYENVDAGDQRIDPFEIYRGKPFGLTLSVVTMEHDDGRPGAIRDNVGSLAKTAYELAKGGAGGASNPALGSKGLLDLWLNYFLPAVGGLVDVVLNMGDDLIGTSTIDLSARNMVLLAARTTAGSYGLIPYKVESGLMSGQGASYKAYFTVEEG